MQREHQEVLARLPPHCKPIPATLESKLLLRLSLKFIPRHSPDPSMHDLIPLNLLSPGQSAQVGLVAGLPEAVHRLEELGVRHGAKVEMLQTGNPCIIRLEGAKLCFRGDELIQVLVRCPEVAS